MRPAGRSLLLAAEVWIRAAAAAIVVLGLLVAAAPAALAASADHVLRHEVAKSPAEVRAYWTPKRMRNAQPVDFPDLPPASRRSDDPIKGLGSAKPEGPPVRIPGTPGVPSASGAHSSYAVDPDRETDPANDTLYPQRIHGKIFFTAPDGATGSCSGTVVASPQENLLATAAHCVHEGPGGQFMGNFMFVPGYRYNSRPFDTWPAADLFVHPRWAAEGPPGVGINFSFDLGLAALAPLDGQQIQSFLGSRGITFNEPENQTFDIFGYPQRPNFMHPEDGFGDYDAERLIHCKDPSFQRIENLGDGPSLGAAYCFMQQGSSGGGWVIGPDLGFVNSVVSHGYCQNDPPGSKTVWNPDTQTGNCGLMYGPYFGQDLLNLYNAATTSDDPPPGPPPPPPGPPPPPPPGPPPPPPPAAPPTIPNQFNFGNVNLNRNLGTATLAVRVPGPGSVLVQQTKQVRRAIRQVGGFAAGALPAGVSVAQRGRLVRVPVRPRGKAQRRISNRRCKQSGKRQLRVRVVARVTYRPTGGAPRTQQRRVRLIKRC